MFSLFAQQNSTWQMIIQALSMNGLWVFLAVIILAGTAKHIVEMVLKHRERIAMIESGMHPDEKLSTGPKVTEYKDVS